LSCTYADDVVEHEDTLPAASLAFAHTVVVAFAVTVAAIEKLPPVATPEARMDVLQLELVYSRTVLPASAVPMKLGEMLFPGDVGETLETVGAAGAVLSST
jgi:hypothetical protein